MVSDSSASLVNNIYPAYLTYEAIGQFWLLLFIFVHSDRSMQYRYMMHVKTSHSLLPARTFPDFTNSLCSLAVEQIRIVKDILRLLGSPSVPSHITVTKTDTKAYRK